MINRQKERTLKLVQVAMLAAIELLLSFTPLGYLHAGVIEITFLTIPVAIAATTVGPGASAVISLIFGISSFIQCFGMSAFGMLCFSISPVRTAFLCIVPRLLMGLLVGFLFGWLKKTGKSLLAFTVTSFSAAFFNTLFFVLTFFLLFRNAVLDFGGGSVVEISAMNLAGVFVFLAGLNAPVEIGACTVLSTAIGKALEHYLLPAIGRRVRVTGETDDLKTAICPHCNASFRYRGDRGTCPYCGISYPPEGDEDDSKEDDSGNDSGDDSKDA